MATATKSSNLFLTLCRLAEALDLATVSSASTLFLKANGAGSYDRFDQIGCSFLMDRFEDHTVPTNPLLRVMTFDIDRSPRSVPVEVDQIQSWFVGYLLPQ